MRQLALHCSNHQQAAAPSANHHDYRCMLPLHMHKRPHCQRRMLSSHLRMQLSTMSSHRNGSPEQRHRRSAGVSRRGSTAALAAAAAALAGLPLPAQAFADADAQPAAPAVDTTITDKVYLDIGEHHLRTVGHYKGATYNTSC